MKLPRLSLYLLGQLIGPTALFAFLLTAVIWLSRSLQLLDLVINRGQSAPTFLYLMPAGLRAMKDKVVDIRSDIGAALLNEGEFNTPAKGLTVFIRELDSDGAIRGVFVHDNRNPKRPVTYFAQSGQLAQTSAGARLIMNDGTIEASGQAGAQLQVLKFDRYVFDLDQFAGPTRATDRATSERFLPELLDPDPSLPAKPRNGFIAEAHNRLSQPLYCLVFALVALAAILRGRRARGANALRITLAVAYGVAVRVAGYGVQGLAARDPSMNVLFYLIPLLGAAGAFASLAGVQPSAWLRRTIAAEGTT